MDESEVGDKVTNTGSVLTENQLDWSNFERYNNNNQVPQSVGLVGLRVKVLFLII